MEEMSRRVAAKPNLRHTSATGNSAAALSLSPWVPSPLVK